MCRKNIKIVISRQRRCFCQISIISQRLLASREKHRPFRGGFLASSIYKFTLGKRMSFSICKFKNCKFHFLLSFYEYKMTRNIGNYLSQHLFKCRKLSKIECFFWFDIPPWFWKSWKRCFIPAWKMNDFRESQTILSCRF